MGIYNVLQSTAIDCLRCGKGIRVDIDLYFGFRQIIGYELGEAVVWVRNAQPQNGGRPPNGDMDGVGYAECPLCGRDVHLKVLVRSDKIVAAVPDPDEPGFIPD